MKKKKVFFFRIDHKKIIEGELVENSKPSPMYEIKTEIGNMYVPKTEMLWPDRDELIIEGFSKYYKVLGLENIQVRYGLTNEEAVKYLKLAADRNPENFI